MSLVFLDPTGEVVHYITLRRFRSWRGYDVSTRRNTHVGFHLPFAMIVSVSQIEKKETEA